MERETSDTSYDESDEDFYVKTYKFHYEKFVNTRSTTEHDMKMPRSKGKYIFYLVFYDDEISKQIRKIIKDPDLYGNDPMISTDTLYYCINDLEIKLNDSKCDKDIIQTIINLTRELFEDRYSKIDTMIDEGIINFQSLWYYLDKLGTYYIVKKFKEDVCFKYEYFTYDETMSQCPLIITGSIIRSMITVFIYHRRTRN